MRTKTIKVTEPMHQALTWAIQKAVEELDYYVNNCNPEMDYAAEWPDVAKDNIARLQTLLVLCQDLGETGLAHDTQICIEALRESLPEDSDAKA